MDESVCHMEEGLLERAREAFARRDALGRPLEVNLEGRSYSVRCDGDSFTVYCRNPRPHLPPGQPGWMVCRLSRLECFSLDTREAPPGAEDAGDHAGRARAWVELVESLLS